MTAIYEKRISEFTSASQVSGNDIIPVVRNPASTPETVRVQLNQILNTTGATQGQKLLTTGSVTLWLDDDYSIEVMIGDSSNVITSGSKGCVEVPVSGVIETWRMTSDISGCVVMNVLKSTYSDFPTLTLISGSTTNPKIVDGRKGEATTLSGWTTNVSKGDWLSFYVSSASLCLLSTLSLNIRKTAIS